MTNLPPFLQRTPEQIADEEARQQIARDLHLKGARQTPAEMRIGQAMLAEEAIRKNLDLIDPEAQPDVYRETEIMLAESLAEQGRYTEAAEIDPQWESMVEAIERPDDEFCDCPEDGVQTRNAQGAVTIPVPKLFIATEVLKEGQLVPLVVCAKCGQMNATPEHDPTHGLAAIETNRNEAFAN